MALLFHRLRQGNYCQMEVSSWRESCAGKAINESIIENAFLEMFGLIADNFDDVLESVLFSVEETISKDKSSGRLKQVEKDIGSLEKKRNKLTDMMLDDKISKEAYEEKYEEFNQKLKKANEEKDILSRNVLSQKNIQNRMRELRAKLADAKVLDKFDRVVFESIVQKVIVGETAEDGIVDPYKLTFVLKGMDNEFIPNAKNRYKNLHKQAI